MDAKFASVMQRNEVWRFQIPFRGHLRPVFYFRQFAPETVGERERVGPTRRPPIGNGSAAGRAKVDDRFPESPRSLCDPFVHFIARWEIDKNIFFRRSSDLGKPIVHPSSDCRVPLIQIRLLVLDAKIRFQPDQRRSCDDLIPFRRAQAAAVAKSRNSSSLCSTTKSYSPNGTSPRRRASYAVRV